MTPCALCSTPSQETVLVFHHVRRSQRVALEIALCEGCGDRIEKHLKRAVPKRLMENRALDRLAGEGAPAGRPRERRSAA